MALAIDAEAKRAQERGRKPQTIDPLKLLLDPAAGTPLGRLLLNGVIDRRLYDVGAQLAVVIYRFKITSGIPFELPTRLRLGEVRGASGHEWPADVIASCRRRYAAARKTLLSAGEGVAEATMRCCWEEVDQPPDQVKRGLQALAREMEV